MPRTGTCRTSVPSGRLSTQLPVTWGVPLESRWAPNTVYWQNSVELPRNIRRARRTGVAGAFPVGSVCNVSVRIGDDTLNPPTGGTSNSCVTLPTRPLVRSRTTTFAWYDPVGSVNSRDREYQVIASRRLVSGLRCISIVWL